MLDDLRKINEKDPHDAVGTTEKQWRQLEYQFDLGDWKPDVPILNIVHSGMGSSALWALLSRSWPGWNVPFDVVRDYDIPAYVDQQTLFIASSYSGDTEETLSALSQAESRGAQVVVITAGGKLEEIAREKNYPLIALPNVNKPRYGVLYGFKGLVQLGEQIGLLATQNAASEMNDDASFLREAIEGFVATVPTSKNIAKQLALEVMGKSVIIYSGPLLAPAAHKWKINFNLNSKNVAWDYAFPEFNHNELAGWTAQPEQKPFTVLFLASSFDDDRIQKRFKLSEQLLSGRWPAPEQVMVQGETKLQQLLWAVVLGDFVSIYTALLNNVSPIDIGDKDIAEKFKRVLAA